MNISRILRGVCAALALWFTSPDIARAQAAGDSVLARAQRYIREGDAARGRGVIDSVFRASRDGTDARAQALYWRALVASDSSAAEDDYVTIVVEYALSPYAADALLRLGQREYSRGARTEAITHLQRLVLEHRSSSAAAEGWLWLGYARIANNDGVNGCIALDSARKRIPSTDVELLNRIAYITQSCRADNRVAAASADTVRKTDPTRTDDVATDSARSRKDAAPGGKYSVQVGALKTKVEADRLVARMKEKGHTARIDKTDLYKVRIGSFQTRAEASKLVATLKREKIDAIVVEVPRRGP